MKFTTIYDIMFESPNYSVALKSIIFFCVGVISIILTIKRRKQNKIYGKVFFTGIAFVLLSLIWLVLIGGMEYYSIHSGQKAIIRKQYRIIEGHVKNYNPMPYEGHAKEEFDVGNVHFEFSDYDLGNTGYHNARSHGGAIKKNLYVKITYIPIDFINPILKLEVAN